VTHLRKQKEETQRKENNKFFGNGHRKLLEVKAFYDGKGAPANNYHCICQRLSYFH